MKTKSSPSASIRIERWKRCSYLGGLRQAQLAFRYLAQADFLPPDLRHSAALISIDIEAFEHIYRKEILPKKEPN